MCHVNPINTQPKLLGVETTLVSKMYQTLFFPRLPKKNPCKIKSIYGQ